MKTTTFTRIILFLVTALLISVDSRSQAYIYHPFPTSNTIWIGNHTIGTDEQTSDNYNLYISGDTTIGVHTYHKLYQNGHVSYWPPNFPDHYYYGAYQCAFREDIAHKKIYLYKNGVDTLAYDFNLNVGDTLRPSCLSPLGVKHSVRAIDSVLVGNQYRKRFLLNGCDEALIEGIGNTYGLLAWIECPFEWFDVLYCVRINNQIVWTKSTGGPCTLTSIDKNTSGESKVNIAQNPFSSTTTFTTSINLVNASLFIYDSSGRLVKQLMNVSGNTITLHRDNLPSGLYLFRLNQGDTIIATEKLIVADN